MTKRIGVLTSGGDAPGQNVCLKALVSYLVDEGFAVVGIRKGWEGLVRLERDDPSSQTDNTMVLTKPHVRDIDRLAGSFLHSSRLSPAHVEAPVAQTLAHAPSANGRSYDLTSRVLDAIERLGLGGLVVLGNTSGLQYAASLSHQGVPVIGIPMSVENHVNGSDYALGFSTALASGVRHLNELRAMAGSREDIAVAGLIGRTYGLTTALIAALSGADRVLIPEVTFDPERLAALLRQDKRAAPANYALLAVSESVSVDLAVAAGYEAYRPRWASRPAQEHLVAPLTIAADREIGVGAGGGGAVVTEILENLLGERLIFQPLTYLLRVGLPDGQDLLGAANFAWMAAHLVAAGEFGRLIAYRRGVNYVDIPLQVVLEPDGKLDMVDCYDRAAFRTTPALMWAARI